MKSAMLTRITIFLMPSIILPIPLTGTHRRTTGNGVSVDIVTPWTIYDTHMELFIIMRICIARLAYFDLHRISR